MGAFVLAAAAHRPLHRLAGERAADEQGHRRARSRGGEPADAVPGRRTARRGAPRERHPLPRQRAGLGPLPPGRCRRHQAAPATCPPCRPTLVRDGQGQLFSYRRHRGRRRCGRALRRGSVRLGIRRLHPRRRPRHRGSAPVRRQHRPRGALELRPALSARRRRRHPDQPQHAGPHRGGHRDQPADHGGRPLAAHRAHRVGRRARPPRREPQRHAGAHRGAAAGPARGLRQHRPRPEDAAQSPAQPRGSGAAQRRRRRRLSRGPRQDHRGGRRADQDLQLAAADRPPRGRRHRREHGAGRPRPPSSATSPSSTSRPPRRPASRLPSSAAAGPQCSSPTASW